MMEVKLNFNGIYKVTVVTRQTYQIVKQGKQSTRELKPGLMQDSVENETDVRFDTYSGSGTEKKLYRQNYIKK